MVPEHGRCTVLALWPSISDLCLPAAAMSMAQERISSQRDSLEQLTCMLCNIAATAHASQGTVRLYTGDFALQHFAVIFPRSATSGTCVSQKCVTDIPYLSDLGYVQVPKASLWGMPILVVEVRRGYRRKA